MVASSVLPYGQWPSPITVEVAATTADDFSWPSIVDGNALGPDALGQGEEEVWWCAADRGTATVRLLRRRPGAAAATEVLGAQWSVRSRIIEYGGRPYLATAGLLVFVNQADQRLYRADPAAGPAAEPWPLTPADPDGVAT